MNDMSSGAPAWMVFVTAVLAVVGTLAAAVITQVLSGRREARQWERQKAQDEARWERERAERREQWEREDHARWHQERHAAYNELLQCMENWDMAVLQMLARHPIPAILSKQGMLRLGDALLEIAQAAAKARVFASDLTTKAVADYLMNANDCYDRLDDGGLDDPERLDSMRLASRKLEKGKIRLLAQIRRDLGIAAKHS